VSKAPKASQSATPQSSGVTPGKGTDASNCPPLADWQAPASRGGWFGGKRRTGISGVAGILTVVAVTLGLLAPAAQAGTKWGSSAPRAAAMPQKWGPWQYCAVAGHAGYETRIRVTGTPAGRWAPDQAQVRRVLSTTKTPPSYNKIMVDWYDGGTWMDGWDYSIRATTRSTTLDLDPTGYTSVKRPTAKVSLGTGVSATLCAPVFPASVL
jgi:hypothetical protein